MFGKSATIAGLLATWFTNAFGQAALFDYSTSGFTVQGQFDQAIREGQCWNSHVGKYVGKDFYYSNYELNGAYVFRGIASTGIHASHRHTHSHAQGSQVFAVTAEALLVKEDVSRLPFTVGMSFRFGGRTEERRAGKTSTTGMFGVELSRRARVSHNQNTVRNMNLTGKLFVDGIGVWYGLNLTGTSGVDGDRFLYLSIELMRGTAIEHSPCFPHDDPDRDRAIRFCVALGYAFGLSGWGDLGSPSVR